MERVPMTLADLKKEVREGRALVPEEVLATLGKFEEDIRHLSGLLLDLGNRVTDFSGVTTTTLAAVNESIKRLEAKVAKLENPGYIPSR